MQDGVIRREERFGYVELAVSGFTSPCFAAELNPGRRSDPPPFITVSKEEGVTRVAFDVEMAFDFESGRPLEWRRLEREELE